MQLLMTMHERVARIICDKVYLDCVQRHDVDDVLHQSAHLLLADTSHLKRVSVQVHRMLVSAPVAKNHPITLALLHEQRLDVGPGFVVDGPGVELGAMQGAVVAKR